MLYGENEVRHKELLCLFKGLFKVFVYRFSFLSTIMQGKFMSFLVAGLLASAAVFILNRWSLRIAGEEVIVYLAPLVEESAKTVLAVALGASIFFTHATFGTVEAVWDIFGSRRNGILAGAAGYFGHMLFGFLAERLFFSYASVFPAVAGSYAVHVAWNLFVMKILVRKQQV